MKDYIVLAALCALFYGFVKLLRIGRRPANYPPGPPTIPIVGNIHQVCRTSLAIANTQIPARDTHLQFQKWAKEYGPIYTLMVGTKTLIVLSSDQAVKDLMDKKSNIYSSRPDLYVVSDLISGGYRMLFMKYAQQWRMIRKMIHSLLNVQAARTYVPYQDLENKQMLNDLLNTPDDFVNHMRRYRTLWSELIKGMPTV
jgi:cytochrome P450